jgi:tetratricopeptide (TPR) repeat protein
MSETICHYAKCTAAAVLFISAIFLTVSDGRCDEPPVQLRSLQSEALKALGARDAQKAYELALKLDQAAEANADLNQPVYLLTAAAVMNAVGMTDESRRVMGVRAGVLKDLPTEIDAQLIAELLNEISPFSQTIGSFHSNMQFELLSYYQRVLTGTLDRTVPSADLMPQLEQLLGEHEQRLLEAKVPVAVASILSVGNLLAAVEWNDTDSIESWLKRLQPLLESDDVAPKWKALVWNKATELSILKRHFSEALEHGRQFAVAAVQSGDFDAQVTCVEQLAVVYLYMGDYAASRFLLSQTEAAQRANPNIQQANLWRVNMSKALEGDREYLLARQLLIEARDLSREVISFDSVMIRNNLAINYYLTGNLAEAHQSLQECQALLPKIDASDLQLAESHITAGWFNLAEEKLELARSEFQKAQELVLKIPDVGQNHPRFAEAFACEARVAAAMGDPSAAKELIVKSESLAFAGVLNELTATGANRDRLAILQAARVHPESISWPGVLDTYLELAETISIPIEKQFDVVLKWKGVLGRLEATQRESTASAEILALNQQLRDLYFRPVSRRQRKQHLQDMELIENEIRVRERSLAQSMLAEQSSAQLPTTSTLFENLDAATVFVDILQVRKFRSPGEEGAVGASGEYLAFIALPDGKVHRSSLGEMDQIDANIDNWRKQIVEQKSEARLTSQVVADSLQQPLLKYLAGADTLLIREDGM